MFFISDYDWSVMERFEYETYDTMDPEPDPNPDPNPTPDPDPNPQSQVKSMDCGVMFRNSP